MTAIEYGHRLARKAHLCDWCGETIKAGEKYEYCKSVESGKWYTTRLHTECHAALGREERLEGADFELDMFYPGDRWRGLTDYETEEQKKEAMRETGRLLS